jgi:hypothetical protein
MPRNIKVISAPEFIRAQPEGRANLEDAETMLTGIAEAGAGLEDFQVLVDVRKVSGALEPADLWRLAQKLATHRRTFGHRTAVLCPLEKFDNARFFAMCAENRGINVHAFTSYEDAMEWLISDS